MARVRSPNFPVISLPEAIERLEVIYDKEQTVPADRETLAEHLGYSGLNGASMKILSALKKYELLEDAGDRTMRASKLAMTILHPSSEQEKQDALRAASEGPALFRQLNEIFEGQRPSEPNLRSWLLRNGFSKSAVDNAMKAYNETMDLVGATEKVYKERTQSQPVKVHSSSHDHRASSPATGERRMASVPMEAPNEPFSVEMLKGRVRVFGELSDKEDAQTLLDFLKSAIAFLPNRNPQTGNDDDDEEIDT